jgi:hypothetical protein
LRSTLWQLAWACLCVIAAADVPAEQQAPAASLVSRFAPLPPFAAAPRPSRTATLVPAPAATWLPPARLAETPRLVPLVGQQPVRRHPVAELPELAWLLPPPAPLLRAEAPAHVASPDPTVLLGLLTGSGLSASMVPRRSWLPPANPPAAPHRLSSDGRYSLVSRPVRDLPPLAFAPAPFTPSLPELPTTPRAYAALPDPAQVPLQSAAFASRPDRPTVAADPTLDFSQQRVLSPILGMRLSPAPFLRLAIPDPFELVTAVELHRPLPDDDPPAPAPGLPERPPLPVTQ